MPKVIYVDNGGNRREVEVPAGSSVMEGAINNDIDGIVAECGGACACATCHVYVDEDWRERLPAMDDMENDMLECTAAERREGSRLSCQIKVSDALDGLVVRLPEFQS